MLKDLREKLETIRWEDAAELSWWVKLVRRQVGLYFYILRELVRDRCLHQAAALTFTTLLSLVPLFAVAFSLYRSFAGIERLADRAQDAIFHFVLARPLVERVVPAEEAGPSIAEAVAAMSPQELLDAAAERSREGDGAGALRLYAAALEAGADADEVRRRVSRLHLPPARLAVRYLEQLSPDDVQRYREAAGLPAPQQWNEELVRIGRESFGEAVEAFDEGRFDEALTALNRAEQAGYSPAETRVIAGRTHLEAARQHQAEGRLTDAAEHYQAALRSYSDALFVRARQRMADELAPVLADHRDARQSLGHLLLELGKEEANLYRSVAGRAGASPEDTLRAAVQDLGNAAELLEDPAPAHIALAELLWETADRREEARGHYEAALQGPRGVAAQGISTVAADYIRAFIDKVGQARIGILATVFLIVTATSLLSTIEKTLNNIWKVTEKRSFWVKFTSFWTLICLGPLLIGATIWVQESLGRYFAYAFRGTPVLGPLVRVVTTVGHYVLPFITTWLLLVAVYKFLPHTRVKFVSAAWGAFIGALLLTLARPLFTLYVMNAIRYERIYGSLGAIPIFLLWLWLLWVIVLFGAEVSFTIQNVGLLRYHDKLRRLSDVFIDRYLAARIMMYVAREFWESGEPVTAARLAEILQITPEEASDAANRLVKLGLLTPVGGQMDEFHPARDLSRLKLSEVLSITDRFRAESRSTQPENTPYEDRLEAAFRSAIAAQDETLGGMTFRDLLEQCERERNKWPQGGGLRG